MEPIISLRITKTTVGLIGIIGNGLVCIVIYFAKSMHTITNLFIFNQAIVDFLGCLLLILGSNVPVPDPLPPGPAGAFLCRVWISDALLWLSYSASTFSLVMLTFERYFAIVYPFRYRAMFAHERLVPGVMIAASWMIGVLVAIYGGAIFAPVDDHCVPVNIPGASVLGLLIICLQYALPLVFMVFAYVSIILELRRSSARVGAFVPSQATTGETSSNPDPNRVLEPRLPHDPLRRARLNTMATLVIIAGAYVVCWTPNEVIFFLFNLGWQLDFSSPLYVVSVALVAINSCVNPLIYAIKYKQFKRAMKMLFRRESELSHATMETEMNP
ncbi:beta-3 adrenergic receptor-like [Patiria miniata]|uniref:G-protein coupled receptors family 1 profile domain-containing protein n=1 Tax=Patiria miniata TaxID=46514 RepID=A0A914BHQ9_PATMI|nr:beta-3 adrenergic receptor-like [Patiria miniata]